MRLYHCPGSPLSLHIYSVPRTYMTDWDSPTVLVSEYCASFIYAKVLSSETSLYASDAYVTLVHVLLGLYV